MISFFGLNIFPERAEKGTLVIGGLTRPVKGLVAASVADKIGRPVVVVCDKAAAAEELVETLRFFIDEGAGTVPVMYFPPWEILPYEDMSPHPDVSGQRLSTLAKLLEKPKNFILVTTVEAVARRTLPPTALGNAILRIDKGDSLDMELLAMHLHAYGYRRADMVEEKGDFSIRGGIVDVFPTEGEQPVRMEFFGDVVDSIRHYNPGTQRSHDGVDGVTLYPFREVFYEGVEAAALMARFKILANEIPLDKKITAVMEEALREKTFFPGMEKLLPIFFPENSLIFDYLPDNAALIVDEPSDVEKHMETFYSLITAEWNERVIKKELAPNPGSLFFPGGELGKILADTAMLKLCELAFMDGDAETVAMPVSRPERYKGKVEAFIADLRKLLGEGYTATIIAGARAGEDRLSRTLADEELYPRRLERNAVNAESREGNLFITTGKLFEGFMIPSAKMFAVTDDEIFGKTQKIKRRVKAPGKAFAVGLADLKKGDHVVHQTHGVGRYIGTREMVVGDAKDEYLELEYAELQKLLLPMSAIHLIKKYTSGGGDARPSLDRMGGTTWKKTKARVRKAVMEMAGKLLKIHASRELAEAFAFTPDNNFHHEFADMFEYEETEDQLSAIDDIMTDMEKSKAMDRLVCGDVGYGKTEVAMRAAFKAVYDGKQVATLVPTTLLAQQHYQTFMERFKAFPVRIECLSRFRSKKEQKEIILKAAGGGVDILIGTHRLLQKDVMFKNLGLVIIDEEQRFGVAHKEKLRGFATGVDTLTLTATPIPRTLHTAMLGIRDLSVIETPPVDRQSIRTFIVKFNDKILREAVMREMDRGGQVFFVHNKVRSIHSLAKHIKKIIPEARLTVAHGQMAEADLERVMTDFVEKKFDILVATTIIESGLDISSANTIVINRADHFGLSQLYQLRGRVGRSRHRAYCYLLIPGLSVITDVAKKRLKAIEELSDLGSGFRLAARDMEIRGAGNLLGPEQSGNIDAVGFDTYCEMLDDAIRELKGEVAEDRWDVNMNLNFQGRIPAEYVPALNHRMDIYNRINAIATPEQLSDMEDELKDRFGPLPEETEKLLATARMRVLCKILRVEKVDMIRDRLMLNFSPSTGLKPDKLATAAYKSGRKFKFTTETSTEYILTGSGWRERFRSIRDFLEFLVEHSK